MSLGREGLDWGYVAGCEVGEEGLGDRKVLPLVVDCYIGFLEEGAA